MDEVFMVEEGGIMRWDRIVSFFGMIFSVVALLLLIITIFTAKKLDYESLRTLAIIGWINVFFTEATFLLKERKK